MPTRNRCNGCIRGKSICVYANMNVIDTEDGKKYNIPTENMCIIGKEDKYAIDVDTELGLDGIDHWRRCTPIDKDPFVINPGDTYNWESLSPHNSTGDAWQINRHDHIPPLYHERDWIEPTAKGIKNDDTCDVIGHNNFSLVLDRWVEDGYGQAVKLFGIPRVEMCRGLYGMPDLNVGIGIHKSMRSWWKQIPWWVNYTVRSMNTTKSPLNIHTSPWEKIEEAVCSFLVEERTQARLLEAYIYLKSNKYVPIRTILKVNGIDDDTIRIIQDSIAVKNPRDIYYSSAGTKYNIRQIKTLYFSIKNGKFPINKEDKIMYMSNIVNYLLNDKMLGSITPANLKYSPSERYWEALDVIASAIYDDNLINKELLPDWVNKLTIQDVNLFAEKPKGILIKSLYGSKENHTKYIYIEDEYDKNPPVLPVRELLKISGDIDEKPFTEFTMVLRAIKRISPDELKDVWFNWKNAWHKNNPELFWDYIKCIISGRDYENICTLHTLENPYNWATDIYEASRDTQTFQMDIKEETISPFWKVDEYKPELTYEDIEDWTDELC